MKKLLLFVFAAVAFAACEQAPIEEQSAIRQDAPDTITVGFEGDDTRIQLNEAQKTVWNSGDEVSVFYRSNGNQKWQYKGEDGVRQATLSRVQNATGNTSITKTIVVYPYDETYWLNTDSYCIEATAPATQHYAVDSYGVGDNLMVSQGEFTQFSLKNVYGWLKLQLTGDGETIKSIKFRGNDGEQVAGLIYVDTATAEATLAAEMGSADDNNAGGNLVFEDTILTEVTLDCGEGVTLGAETTSFYVAIPPQTFEKGFEVEIVCADDTKMVKSSSNTLTIERNHIQPMAAMEFVPPVPNNQIWYTSSDGNIVKPRYTNVFGANITSNTYSNGKGVITFDGDVTTIGERAFYKDCTRLTSVTIPDSVTTIGESAFYDCTRLTSVTIGDSVTTIGNSAFYNCTSLTSVTIPDSVTTIGNDAFYCCESLTSVTIPDSVTTIGNYAFAGCTSLTSVTIPDSVTTIGGSAFAGCGSLTEFKGKFASEDGRSLIMDNTIIAYANASGTTYTIPDNVTTIGEGAFAGCDSLTSVNIPDSVTTIGEGAFSGCDSLTSVTIGNSVTSIGNHAFHDCDSLTSVTIPDSVTTIGSEAFHDCDSLTSVNIPDSVTTIGYGAFSYCDSLTSVTIGDSVTEIGGSAFTYCSSLTSVTIGDSVMLIGYEAFSNCDSLTSVNIGDSVTTIGYGAFSNCDSLTSVNIPDRVSTIGDHAFDSCDSLASVNIPDSVTTIGYGAFYGCDSLTSVTIGDSVTKIGGSAFEDCTSLTSVYCKATTPPSFSNFYVFDNNGSGRKIYVPIESVDAYKSATLWSKYASAIVGYDF